MTSIAVGLEADRRRPARSQRFPVEDEQRPRSRRGLQARDDTISARRQSSSKAAIILDEGDAAPSACVYDHAAGAVAARLLPAGWHRRAFLAVAIGAQPLLGHEIRGRPDEGELPGGAADGRALPRRGRRRCRSAPARRRRQARHGRHERRAIAATRPGCVRTSSAEAQKAPARRRSRPGSPRSSRRKPPTQADTSSTCATAAPITCQTGRSRPNG